MKHDSLLLVHDSLDQFSLSRNTSGKTINPSNYIITTTTSFTIYPHSSVDDKLLLVGKDSPAARFNRSRLFTFSTIIRSFLTTISIPALFPTCRWLRLPSQHSLTPSLGRKVTGTLFGNRRGHVSFSVQSDPRSAPVFIVELGVSTAALVKDMSSGLVRITLECEKQRRRLGACGGDGKLFNEPTWSMYCNGRKCGYASSRACTVSDWHVLSTVQSVSVGAGVIPVVEGERKSNASGSGGGESEGELVYMRARFERVVGNRDSEAYYMMNPDGTRGPELSIFLLRI